MMRHLLIGGTGTLGHALAERLYNNVDLTVMSRGELAQKEMALKFPGIKMIIGDVRDSGAVYKAMAGMDTVFLLAAIKHVEVAEANPLEAIKTNVHGAINVAESALRHLVKYVVFSNTDKAILPITAYGYSKAIAQQYLLSQNQSQENVRFSVFNWGNVAGSRGSVIPTFVKKLLANEPIQITHPEMTRFWIQIEKAALFMLKNYRDASLEKAMIPPIKAASVMRVVESIARILGVKSFRTEIVGIRGIEKIHEVLESNHDKCLRSDTCEQYTDQELDELLGDLVRGLSCLKDR